MFFFALVAAVTLLAALAGRLGAPGLAGWPARMRLGLAVALALAGADHLANPWRYLPMLPEAVPLPARDGTPHRPVRDRRRHGPAGAAAAPPRRDPARALFRLRLPGQHPQRAGRRRRRRGLPVAAAWYYWLRLGFQPLVVWWALRAAEVIAWPQRPARRHAVGA